MFNLLPLLLLVNTNLSVPPLGLLPGDSLDDPKGTPKKAPAVAEKFQHPKGIAWIGTWDTARAEAKRTGKAILLLSAAPQCRGIPGIW